MAQIQRTGEDLRASGVLELDGDDFDAVHPDVATELEALVANLPAIESLHDTETGAMGTVISQVLD